MNKLVNEFMIDESGATAIEYGLIVALIGVALIGAASALGTEIQAMFTNIGEQLSTTGQAFEDATPSN